MKFSDASPVTGTWKCMQCSLYIGKATFLLEIHYVFVLIVSETLFTQNTKCDGWSERSLTKSNVNLHKKESPVSRDQCHILRLVILPQWSIDPSVKYTSANKKKLMRMMLPFCSCNTVESCVTLLLFAGQKMKMKFGYHIMILCVTPDTTKQKGTGSITFW